MRPSDPGIQKTNMNSAQLIQYKTTNLVIPLFVATIRMGAMSLSRARFKNEKHSMSSMCTSSMKRTWRNTCLHLIFQQEQHCELVLLG